MNKDTYIKQQNFLEDLWYINRRIAEMEKEDFGVSHQLKSILKQLAVAIGTLENQDK